VPITTPVPAGIGIVGAVAAVKIAVLDEKFNFLVLTV
jgi:hypothetical protein